MTIFAGMFILIAALRSVSGKFCIAPVYCTEESGSYPGWMQISPSLQFGAESKRTFTQEEPTIYENPDISFKNTADFLTAEIANVAKKFEDLNAIIEGLSENNTKLHAVNTELSKKIELQSTTNTEQTEKIAVLENICSTIDYQGKVRLVNGTSSRNGRVEIFYNGTWGTVCDDYWSDSTGKRNADVICKQLLFTRATWFSADSDNDHRYGGETGPMWLDDVTCKGTESLIGNCRHESWGENDCSYLESVAVECE